MEKALAAIHQGNRAKSAIQLLYRSHEQQVGLWLRSPDSLADVVTAAIEASYPNCRLVAFEENEADNISTHTAVEIWSAELRLVPDLFPILRHSQFQDLQSGNFADPIDSILRAIQPNQHLTARIELSVTPVSRKRYRRAKWAIERLNSPSFRLHFRLAALFARASTRRRLWLFAWIFGTIAGRRQVLSIINPIDTSTGRHHEREDDVQSASDKVGGHLFETRIRLVVAGPRDGEASAYERLRTMAGALGSFTVSRLATFRMTRIRRGQPRALPKRGFLMSHEELATLFHPPTAGVGAERMHTNDFTEKEAPVSIPSGKRDGEVALGRVKFRSDTRSFGIAREDRRRHVYIVGKTGMGKTALLQSQILADIEAGRGVCLIDPHGDLAEETVPFIPPRRTNEVIVFDAADRDYAVSFNPLACSDEERIDQVTSGVVSAFRKIYDSWGPRLEDTLRNAVFATVEQGGTLRTVLRLLSDQPFRERFVQQIRDDLVRSFWIDEFAHWNDRYRTEAVAAIQNKIRPFLTNRRIRAIVGRSHKSLDLRKIMDDEQVLIVNLSKGRIGEDNSTLLGALLVASIQQAAMSRADVSEHERRDFYLYVDEFQSFTTGSFATILSEARKYRLNLTVAHQYLKQLDEDTANAVFGNVGSIVAFSNLGTHRAIKVPRPLPAKEQWAASGLEAEAATMGGMTHPSILKLYAHGFAQWEAMQWPWLITDFLEPFVTLDSFAVDSKTTVRDLIQVFFDLADALDFFHTNNLLHLDIKPSNCNVLRGRGVLLDFGSVQRLDATADEEIFVSYSVPWAHPLIREKATGTTPASARQRSKLLRSELCAEFDLYSLGFTILYCWERFAAQHREEVRTSRSLGRGMKIIGCRLLRRW